MKSANQKPKIFQLITNLGPGGAQRVFYDHCQSLAEKYTVDEIVFDKDECPALLQTTNKLHSLDVKGGRNIGSKMVRLWQRCINLRRLVSRLQPEVVISHLDGANWVNVLSFTGKKKILVIHGSVLRDAEVKGFHQLLRRHVLFPLLYNRAQVTVAVSDGVKKELEQCGVRNAVAIPNFFDNAEIAHKATGPLPPLHDALFRRHDVLITSGRFALPKNQSFLISLFAALKKSHPHLKLVLLGDGELRQQIIDKVTAEGLSYYSIWSDVPFTVDKDVYFLGYVSNPFMYLAKSRLFLFPSGWEGFPMALCEAMICGVPVLAADCPTGPRQILAPQTSDVSYSLSRPEHTPNGLLLPLADKPDAVQQWLSGTIEALANSEQRKAWSDAAKQRMLHFDKDKVAHQWHALIDSLLYKKQPAAHSLNGAAPLKKHAVR